MKISKILLCLLLGLCSVSIKAQDVDNNKFKGFRFVYIAHDFNTPVGRLAERLKTFRNYALEDGEDVVFYMASGSNPIVVECGVGKNNIEDFENVLLPELNEKNSHDVDPETDLEVITEILNNIDFAGYDKKINYNTVKFNFFVSPRFWTLKNNEAIIVPIFFTYDVPNLTGGRVQFQLFEAREDRLPEGNLFGEKDVEGINKFTATDRVIY